MNFDEDIAPHNASQLLQLHRDIMEIVVLGQDHQLVLDRLCQASEQMVPDALASVMLFNESQTSIEVKSAPSLPEAARQALKGLSPGTHNGSCANAVYSNEPQFICNTLEDPRWKNVRQFANDFNIGACWSMPIRTTGNTAVGSFALSSFEERAPTSFQVKLLETSAHLAGIVLKRQMEESQLWEMAHYDALTNIPNRVLLNMRLEHAISKASRQQLKLALLFLDVDNFKDINDTYGHETGDKVLLKVSDNINTCIRTQDTLARMGGDEFMILLEDIYTSEDAEHVAEKILHAFCHPISIKGTNHLVSASIGISLFPEHGNNEEILQQNADTAMYAAKNRGKNCYATYEVSFSQDVEARVKLSNELREALRLEQFVLLYQPQFTAVDETLCGVEVQVYWHHPERGMLAPEDFVPITEESGFINLLGDWQIKSACEFCASLLQSGASDFTLVLKISVKQLITDYANHLFGIISATNFPIELVEIEIFESLLVENSETAIIELHKIKALGINICLDNFGTGHASLAQLKHLPISKLKIDRSFVQDIADAKNDRVIAHSIIAVGHSMQLKIIADGVETNPQKVFLVNEGCDELQGDLLSKPLTAAQLADLLHNRQTEF